MPQQFVLSVLFIISLAGCAYAGEPASPAMLAQPCAACHGTDGHSRSIIPSLDQMSAGQLYRQMLLFKTGQRHATLMSRIARGYSDEELLAIANYLAKKQTP